MSWLDGIRYIASSLVRRGKQAEEREDEFAFHVQMEADRLRREGVPAARARIEAVMRLGLAPHSGPSWRWRFETVRHDLRHAIRTLLRSPSYAITTLATLSVALSVAMVSITVVGAVLVHPLPFPRDNEMMVLRQTDAQRPEGFAASLPNFSDWKSRSHSFAGMAAWADRVEVVAARDVEARSADISSVTADYFSILGVSPLMGRTIGSSDAVAGAPSAIVISHRLWQEMFGGDSHIIGRQVRIGARPSTVVGVMPPSFRYPVATDIWQEYPAEFFSLMPRNTTIFSVIARRRSPATPEEANRDLDAIAHQLHAEYPDLATNQATGARAISLRDALFHADRPMILLLGSAMLFALIVACLNLACANLARTARRRGDFIIREALGASRARQLQYWVVEAAVISIASAAIALPAASVLIRALTARPEFMALQTARPGLDGGSVAAAGFLVLLVTAFIGWWPAWRMTRRAHRRRLAIRATGTPLRTMAWLVMFEIAMAMVLLVGAVLAVRTAIKILAQPRGFDSANVLTVDLRLPILGANKTVQLLDRILDSVRTLPGVVSAGMVNSLPLTADPGRKPRNATGIRVVDQRGLADSVTGAGFHAINGDYFTTMRIPLRQGRGITPADDSTAPRVAVISQSMANRYWPNADPLGQQFVALGADPGLFNKELTVVGVVGDVRASSLEEPELPDYYIADRQGIVGVWKWYLVIKTSIPPERQIAAVRRILRAADARTALTFAAMNERITQSLARRLFASSAMTFIAGAGLLVVVIGVYGVLSYTVVTREREIGVRMALGASRRRVQLEVLRAMLTPVAAGLLVGTAGSLLLAGIMTRLVFELSPRDPVTLAGAAAAILGTALFAAWLPAHRATGIDPNVALRG